mmetsp:Transcript_75375/g.143473  ORF Transcript_75375/g.143473 Transcript_75375/m.143473 type:complete len:450 (+) Transcript_75375:96-1445(+)
MHLAWLAPFVLAASTKSGYAQRCVHGEESGQASGGEVLLQTKWANSKMEQRAPASDIASPLRAAMAASTFNAFATIDNSSDQYTFAQGEFHRVVFKTGKIEEMLNSPKCRKFYKQTSPTQSPTVVDHALRVFRPAAEVLTLSDSKEPALPATRFKRMRTYEDVAFPKNFHDTNVTGTEGTSEDWQAERFCEMFAIRTPHRPVKVISAQGLTNEKKNLTMPAVWKVASTSLTQMLQEAAKEGSLLVHGPHDNGECDPENLMEQCEKHTTFHQDAVHGNIKAALVRSPLDRFLASVNEHGEWDTCTVDGTADQPCDHMVESAKAMAMKLEQDFPHKYRSCEHPSQAYFLSATDVHGEPYRWDVVMRLENFDDVVQQVSGWIGIELSHREDNTSGDQEKKQKYFDAIFSDLRTLCSVCKVYAQDFECFGYAKPDQCTPYQCSTVDVSLPDGW